MAFPGRRKHQRYVCDLPGRIWRAGMIDGAAPCRIVNLSLGGASIETGARLDPRAEYDLRVAWAGRRRRLRASVAWTDGGTFGLSFRQSPRQEALLRRILDGIRGAGQAFGPSLEKTLKDFWGP